MTNQETDMRMFYVAVDPSQPGAAWAVCGDKPEYAELTLENICSWVRKGATVMRVDAITANEMLDKWVSLAKEGAK